jgi:hypothetical protein
MPGGWPIAANFSAHIASILAPILLAALLGQVPAVDPGDLADQGPSLTPSAAPGTRRALIACGLPGDDEHRAMYAGLVEKLAKTLVDRCGFAAPDVWVRFGTESRAGDGPALKGSRGLSTREGLAADSEEIRKVSTPEDGVWVIVLGHGHFDGRRSHLNLPGPDLSDQEFARLFEGIRAREQVFVLTPSASGFFLKPLATPDRVAISATEADQEVNETLFPHALVEVLSAPSPEADRDKDGALSVFELYLAIVADVTRCYVEDELIPTEHAQLDDNGDGRGTELQRAFLPPQSGGEAEVAKAKGKTKARDKVEPKLGPKDDGALASKIRVDRPSGGKR